MIFTVIKWKYQWKFIVSNINSFYNQNKCKYLFWIAAQFSHLLGILDDVNFMSCQGAGFVKLSQP